MAQRNEIEAPQTTLPIHLKYRPKELRDVFGQDAIVKSIRAALAMRARPHCYLFTR
jgi:DNA polymerase III gamma/tau subunit